MADFTNNNSGAQGRDVPKRLHSLTLDSRTKLSIGGVEQVGSASETQILLTTSAGCMTVSGRDMHIARYSMEEGVLTVDGTVDCLCYTDAKPKKGFFKRMFK